MVEGEQMSQTETDRAGRTVRWRGALIAAALLTMLSVPSGSAAAHPRMTHRVRSGGLGLDAPAGIASVGSDLFVANSGNNSITEVSAATGTRVATISGRKFALNRPAAILAVGSDLFVANAQGDSVTEFRATGHKHLRTIEGTGYGFSDPVALAASADSLYVLSAAGGVTQVSVASGALIGSAVGPAYSFAAPTGLAIADDLVFVANSASNTVTVLNATTMAFDALLSDPSFGFSTPISIAFDGTNVWVTNQSDESVTELSPSTLEPITVLVSGNLPMVGPITYGDGYVFTVSPPGTSPMVSQIVPSPASVTWMMCNTNGPYLFNDPESLIVSGSDLWVANEGGNSLTEMDADSGALIRTVS